MRKEVLTEAPVDAPHSTYLFENFSFWSSDVLRDGFSCGDGWFDLIKTLCEKLAYLHTPGNFVVTQVKEKFGALCFYTSNATPDAERLIQYAISQSEFICEYCGGPGRAQKKLMMWKTVCLFHDTLHGKERAWPSA